MIGVWTLFGMVLFGFLGEQLVKKYGSNLQAQDMRLIPAEVQVKATRHR